MFKILVIFVTDFQAWGQKKPVDTATGKTVSHLSGEDSQRFDSAMLHKTAFLFTQEGFFFVTGLVWLTDYVTDFLPALQVTVYSLTI